MVDMESKSTKKHSNKDIKSPKAASQFGKHLGQLQGSFFLAIITAYSN
jgi:hypothetical protein